MLLVFDPSYLKQKRSKTSRVVFFNGFPPKKRYTRLFILPKEIKNKKRPMAARQSLRGEISTDDDDIDPEEMMQVCFVDR